MKAFGYLRVSGQGKVEGYGFDRQEDEIRSYASKHGIEVVKFFREEGVSGTFDEIERPAFQEMVSEILKNGVRTVIIEGLDRLAREFRIQETLLIYLASKGIELISARTEENVTQAIQSDPMKKALVQIQGIFSELEKSLLVKKLKTARQNAKKARGKCEGAKKFGETSEKERAVVRRIRAMRRKSPRTGKPSMTFQAIADKLNSENITTRRGKKWSAAQVYQTL